MNYAEEVKEGGLLAAGKIPSWDNQPPIALPGTRRSARRERTVPEGLIFVPEPEDVTTQEAVEAGMVESEDEIAKMIQGKERSQPTKKGVARPQRQVRKRDLQESPSREERTSKKSRTKPKAATGPYDLSWLEELRGLQSKSLTCRRFEVW